MEQLAAEKEKQLLEAISQQKLLIAAARKEEAQLRQQLSELLDKSSCSNVENNLEEEVESLRTVLRMRGLELDQMRAANNTLLLEMDR